MLELLCIYYFLRPNDERYIHGIKSLISMEKRHSKRRLFSPANST